MIKPIFLWAWLVIITHGVCGSLTLDSLATKSVPLSESKTAIVITLEEMVDPGMAAYTKRAIKEAVAQKPDVIIFEVNTFGGRLDAAFEIVDEISAIRDIETIALVNKKAISAGALISLSCNKVYMKPSTTIGDCAPVMQGQEGPVMLGEKIQSPLRAKFRNFSQKNGYPELLAQAMVSEDMEVLRIQKGDSIRFIQAHEWEEMGEKEKKDWSNRKTLVRKGELLTLTEKEALEYGFSSGTVESLDELKQKLNIKSAENVHISWAEKLARILGQLAPILMLIGFGALYMEFQSPGFGVFGIIGVICLGIVFGGQYVSELTGKLPLVLMILGALLILVEVVVVPGTYLSGISGIALMTGALIMTLPADNIPLFKGPDLQGTDAMLYAALYIMCIAIIALVFPIFASKYLFPHLPQGYSVIQSATLEDSHIPLADTEHELSVGLRGIAKTDLRPTGRALFKGKTYDVESISSYVAAGSPLKIVNINGNFIKVLQQIDSEQEAEA